MNISRRRFMKTGMIVAATALVPLGQMKTAAAQQSKDGRSNSVPDSKVLNKNRTSRLFYYNKSTFAPYVNSEFHVHLSSSKALAITLVGIEDFSNSQEKLVVGDESFTLEFNGPSGRAFKQQTYEVEHAALGRFSLFIVPVGMPTSKGDISYEAAFNHRNQNSAATSTSSGQKLATR